MEIVTAKNAGFCFGVKRAVDLVVRAARRSGGPVYTLGPLIHNPQEIARLERMGVQQVDSLDDIPAGVVVLSAHGVGPEVEAQARSRGLQVIDATCPFVRRAHRRIRSLAGRGYGIVIIGDRGHREVEGLAARSGGGAHIVGAACEAEALPFQKRYGVVVQTTQRPETLRQVVAALISRCEELRVFDTICEATTARQEGARQLAQRVDVMIVIGGRNSANTARLHEICAAAGASTHHIEVAEELQGEWLAGAERVGVTAGASTPAWVVDQVLARLRELAHASRSQ